MDPLKLYIRGVCISQAAYRHKRKKLHKHLEEAFYKASEKFQTSPSPPNKHNYDKTHLELDPFLTDSAEKTLCKSKHTFYKHANKPNTFLALALRKTNYTPKPIC